MNAASLGVQLGAESSDAVLLFTDEASKSALEKGNVTLGGDVAVTAGPIGAQASADFTGPKGAYSYIKSKGAFVGASLEGAKITVDTEENTAYYGQSYRTPEILAGSKPENMPAGAQALVVSLPGGAQRS